MRTYDLREDGVTQGMLATWGACRQAAAFRCQGWRPDRPKRALQFGSLMHRLLEQWYKAGKESPEEIFRIVALEWQANAAADGDDPKKVGADLGIAWRIFPAYCRHWAKADGGKKWVELEKTFDILHKGFGGVRFRGRVDGVFATKRKELWILETKTTSSIEDETLKQQLSFNAQNLFYLTALELQFGQKIDGVLYNLIRKPQLRQGKDESAKVFWDRIGSDIEARPAWYFVRFEIAYPRRMIKTYQMELQEKLEEFGQWCRGELPTYKQEENCLGRWPCRYLAACASGSMAGYKQETFRFSELEEKGGA